MTNANAMLRRARERYATSPSHLALGEGALPDGTHCAYTALWHGENIQYNADPDVLTDDEAALEEALDALMDAAGYAGHAFPVHALAEWNSTHTTEEVVAGFDRAIEATS